jgi:hypothetical protein
MAGFSESSFDIDDARRETRSLIDEQAARIDALSKLSSLNQPVNRLGQLRGHCKYTRQQPSGMVESGLRRDGRKSFGRRRHKSRM